MCNGPTNAPLHKVNWNARWNSEFIRLRIFYYMELAGELDGITV
jgi:hypothetical protein